MTIERIWAMPNSLTFTIKPIKDLIERYLDNGMVVVDPFANNSKYGTITNDLNPEMNTTHHMDALAFLRMLNESSADVILYDPPYSISQAAECYKSYGKEKLELNVANMGYWAACKDECARILKPRGILIICGWSSNGAGKNRGFEMKEILLVPHGGSKNDTIVTVECLTTKTTL
jgi:tRNA1(Val) A37 N6-methylase TrmN6